MTDPLAPIRGILWGITIGALIWTALGLLLWLVGAMWSAEAHEAPSGWAYDTWCCGGDDCRHTEPGEVTLTPDGRGWHVRTLYQPRIDVVVPIDGTATNPTTGVPRDVRDTSLRVSPDRDFHVCIVLQMSSQFGSFQRLRCLFVPPAWN